MRFIGQSTISAKTPIQGGENTAFEFHYIAILMLKPPPPRQNFNKTRWGLTKGDCDFYHSILMEKNLQKIYCSLKFKFSQIFSFIDMPETVEYLGF